MIMRDIHILLTEDCAGDTQVTDRALKKNNLIKLLYMRNGWGSLDYLIGEGIYAGKLIRNLPHVILLNLKMPGLDGIEVMRRLKSDVRTKNIPVVVFSSSKKIWIYKCYRRGANGYLVEPWEFEAFYNAILGPAFWMNINQAFR